MNMEKTETLSYKLDVFEGPLDLLLNLIAKNKLNIYDIPIAELLEQYMAQIHEMQAADMDVASEFLEMAARLVHIKSVSLLPKKEEEAALKQELTGQLLEYQQCKEAAMRLRERFSLDGIVRAQADIPADLTYKRHHKPQELLSAYLSMLGKKKPPEPQKPEDTISKLITRRVVSVASQIVFVLRSLWKKRHVSLKELFRGKNDPSERVAAFLAVLELVKDKRLRVDGDGEDCEIKLNKKKMLGMMEAILFACGDPIDIDKLAQALNTEEENVLELSRTLQAKYNKEESGIYLLQLDHTLQFAVNPAFLAPVRTALDLRSSAPLSQAAMEVLAVIAYNQPVTKAFVEQVRGVDCSGVIGSLVQKALIEERGRLDLPGKPLLYGTTENFLRCMGIRSLLELPPLPQEEETENAPQNDGADKA